MKKICLQLAYFFTILVMVTSCKKDDDSNTYVALEIDTLPDSGMVRWGNTIDISILSNDTNVPEDALLSLGETANGSVEVRNNSTPNNNADDLIRYTPNGIFIGDDAFQYTVCDGNGENCKTENVTVNVTPISPVTFDIQNIPYNNLSEYNFFEGVMADQIPVYGVLPYEPISALYTDYAKKKRFVWMPEGVKATYTSDDAVFDFPTGSVFIKNFYYENVQPSNTKQIIETRLMIKKEDGWIFAEYVWNENQTEATLDIVGDGGFNEVEWIEDGVTRVVNYRRPATAECRTCHKLDFNYIPLGSKPQSLNSMYDYGDGNMNQLQKWIQQGYLEDNLPGSIVSVVNWEDESQPLELRVRSYLDVNCASCHTDGGHASYRSSRMAFKDSDVLENLGVCVNPDTPVPGLEAAKLITPGDPTNSVLAYRMNTSAEEYRMPLIGRSLKHEEAVALIEEWISSLTVTCD